MASPTVKSFTNAVLNNNGIVSSSADTAIGDLIVCFVWSQGTTPPTHTVLSGFTTVRSHSHDDGTTDGRLSVATTVATAASTQSYQAFTVGGATSGQTCAAILVITGYDTGVLTNTWSQNSSTLTTNAVPNPPSLTAQSGDKLFLAIAAWHVTSAAAPTITPPTNYTTKIDGPTGTSLTHLTVSSRELTGLSNATEDPVAFNDNITPNGSVSMTLAIPGAPVPATYYVTAMGSDSANGTSTGTAWKTLTPVNAHVFLPGDTVLFNGGETFTGGIFIQNIASNAANPVTFGSYGTGRATIQSAAGTKGFYAYNMGGIKIENLNFTGPGVATANQDGVFFYNDAAATSYPYIRLTNCNVTGYLCGVVLGAWNGTSGYNDVRFEGCEFYANKRDGMRSYGASMYSHSNVYIGHCKAYNNTGYAAAGEPTGSGIQISSVNGGTVEYCLAYGNGANNSNAAGPVGIWMYDSTNVVIQNSESYGNLKGTGGDGDGFDIDGGCTNCTVQYCYAHGNQGSGFAMFQYAGASTFSGNKIRYNISEKNTLGEFALWGANGTSTVTNSEIYNNTVYASTGPAIDMFNSNMSGITVKNNIFLSINGVALVDHPGNTGVTFTKNNYYNMSGAFLIWWNGISYASRTAWGQDSTGLSVDPQLTNPGNGGTIGNADNLPTLTAYKFTSAASPMVNAGTTITSPGTKDFYGDTLTGTPDIGADEYVVSDMAFTKSVSDALSLSEGIVKSQSLARGLVDAISMGEVVVIAGTLIKILSDSLAINEAITKSQLLNRSISDALLLSETFAPEFLFNRFISEPFTLPDSVVRSSSKYVFDDLILGDAYIAELVAAVDPTVRNKRASVVGFDATYRVVLPIPDGVVSELDRWQLAGKYYMPFVAGELVLALSDSVNLGDTRSGVSDFVRSTTEALTLSEAISRIMSLARSYSDAIALSDGVLQSATLNRSLTDALSVLDEAAKQLNKNTSDAILLGETINRQLVLVRQVADSMTLSEAIGRVAAYSRMLTEPLSLSDAVTLAAAFSRVSVDTMSLGDSVQKISQLARLVQNAISMGDVVSSLKSGVYQKLLSDAVGLGELLQKVFVLMRVMSDALGLGDSISKVSAFIRPQSDALAMAELLTVASAFRRGVTDPLSLSDLALRTLGRPRADAMVMGDVVSRVVNYSRQQGDSIGLGDIISIASIFRRYQSDVMLLDDVASKVLYTIGGATLSFVDPIWMGEYISIAIESVIKLVATDGLRHPEYHDLREQQDLVSILVVICACLFTED